MKQVLVILGFLSSAAYGQEFPVLNPPTLEHQPEPPPPAQGGYKLFANPTTEWVFHKTADGSHPNGNEQEMVWLTNRARTNPTEEGIYLANTGNSNVESAVSYFSVSKTALQDEFADLDPKPPCAFDRRIYEGSRVHSEDLIARDSQDHNNQFSRIGDAGFFLNGGAASVFAYAISPVYAHAGFNIDWGPDGGDGTGMQPGRGHRRGLMATSLTSTNFGIAMVEESNSSTSVGPLVTSIVYARASTSQSNHYNQFLVGTVWTDSNSNGRYDSGEGHDGVTVMPDSGTYYAVTGSAGGWAIPISSGSYTISFSGGPLSGTELRTAEVSGSESVLVIWNAADSYNPQPPTAPTSLAVTPVIN